MIQGYAAGDNLGGVVLWVRNRGLPRVEEGYIQGENHDAFISVRCGGSGDGGGMSG